MTQYYGKVATLEERWNDIKPYAEHLLKNTDKVLDIGCAEGLLTDEIAKLVNYGHVDAVEKMDNYDWFAKQDNITAFHCDILNFKIIEKYDVIFCLGVLHKLKPLSRQKLFVKLFENNVPLIFLRLPKLEPFLLDICWGNQYSIFQKYSSYHNQGPIYICQKLEEHLGRNVICPKCYRSHWGTSRISSLSVNKEPQKVYCKECGHDFELLH